MCVHNSFSRPLLCSPHSQLSDHCDDTVAEESEYLVYVDCESDWCAFRFWVEYRPIVALPLGEVVVVELPNQGDTAYFSFHRHGEMRSFALELTAFLPSGAESAPEISILVDRLRCPTDDRYNPAYVAEVTHRTSPNVVEVHTISFVDQPAGEYFALLVAQDALVYVEARLLELESDHGGSYWDSSDGVWEVFALRQKRWRWWRWWRTW
jgi:hypothetical protein